MPQRRDGGGEEEAIVRLQVAHFQTASDSPESPLVYLEGGPGGDVFANIALSSEFLVDPWIAERDVVLFSQRGTGDSEPALGCAQYTNAVIAVEVSGASLEQGIQTTGGELVLCRNELVGAGADLAAFNSVESAHDVEALRLALELEPWNVLGVSYGTRLAQTLSLIHI